MNKRFKSELSVLSNYYKIDSTSLSTWSLHTVGFQREVNGEFCTLPKYNISFYERRRIMEKAINENPILSDCIFDGGILVTHEKIEPDGEYQGKPVKNILVEPTSEKGLPTMLAIEYVRVIGNNPDCLNQFVNLLFKRLIHNLKIKNNKGEMVNKYKSDGKNGWYDPFNRIQVGGKIWIWPGIFSTILQIENDYYLHLSIRHKVIHSSLLSEEIRDQGQSIDQDLPFYIVLTYSNEIHCVEEIDWNKTPEYTFERNVKGSEPITVSYVDYYKDRYGITIRDLRQPLLIVNQRVGNKKKGDIIKTLYLIPELCYRTGHSDSARDAQLTREMITTTSKTAQGYQEVLDRFVQSIPQEEIKKNHFVLNTTSIQIPYTKLQLPSVKFANQTFPLDNTVGWAKHLRSSRVEPYLIADNKWVILSEANHHKDCQDLAFKMIRTAKGYNITLGEPQIIHTESRREDDYVKALNRSLNTDHKLVVVFLTTNDANLYQSIKRECIQKGISSQCLTSKTFKKQNFDQIVSNLVLQITAKQGRSIWSIANIESIIDNDVMVCGLSRNKSVVSFTYSYWNNFTNYGNYATRSNEQGATFILEAWKKAFTYYKEISGAYPKIVVLYREKMSKGQMKIIANNEIESYHRAIEELGLPFIPELAYVVYSKGSTTRFYSDGQNLESGSLIDQSIVGRDHYDYYIVSHTSRNAIIKPTEYSIFNYESVPISVVKKIQELTYQLCFQYYNWNGSIKIPNSAMYAEKSASFFNDIYKNSDIEQLNDALESSRLFGKLPFI